MNPLIALIAALAGYLIGSLSFARIVVHVFAPGQQITGTDYSAPGMEQPFHSDAITGTAVSVRLGGRYGCLVGLLDILKVAIPALALRLAFPGFPYFLVYAALALVGHNWPLYYRFQGGSGLSAIMGGFLVADPLGTVITALLGVMISILLKNPVILYMGGLWLMIPWLWFATHSLAYVAYAVFANVIFLLAALPAYRTLRENQRKGAKLDYATVMERTPMGRGILKMATRLGLLKQD
jgi:acyl phosphate:glycerol-3-phosphate acyltransferase